RQRRTRGKPRRRTPPRDRARARGRAAHDAHSDRAAPPLRRDAGRAKRPPAPRPCSRGAGAPPTPPRWGQRHAGQRWIGPWGWALQASLFTQCLVRRWTVQKRWGNGRFFVPRKDQRSDKLPKVHEIHRAGRFPVGLHPLRSCADVRPGARTRPQRRTSPPPGRFEVHARVPRRDRPSCPVAVGCALLVSLATPPSLAAGAGPSDAEATLDERVQLYALTAGYGAVTGYWIHELSGGESWSPWVLPGAGVTALSTATVAWIDQGPGFRLGQAQAIVTDTWIGGGIAGLWLWHDAAREP